MDMSVLHERFSPAVVGVDQDDGDGVVMTVRDPRNNVVVPSEEYRAAVKTRKNFGLSGTYDPTRGILEIISTCAPSFYVRAPISVANITEGGQ